MLSLSNITVEYPGHAGTPIRVVDDVSLTVSPGERVVLLGANGSGKSSFMRTALALGPMAAGAVAVDGLNPYDPSQTVAARSLVGYVGQRPDDQIVATSVEDEAAFGPENLGLDRGELRRRVDAALAFVGLDGLERREPHTLSGGQKQRLSFAGALAMEPRYLLLDEPMSMLDEASRTQVRGIVDSYVARGSGMLMITHDVSDAAGADRVVVLSAGRIVFDGAYAELVSGVHPLDQWGLALSVPPVDRPATEASSGAGINLSDISVRYDAGFGEVTAALQQANFSVRRGELVVIKGPTGAGKSTLLRVCAGLLDPTGGVVTLDGAPLTKRTARGRVGLMFQDPESALFADTVLEDVAFGPKNFGASSQSATATAQHWLAQVGLDPERFGNRSPFSLSGGEARLAAIAGVLAIEPDFVLADEPTSALDARGRLAVRRQLVEATRRCGVVVVTHTPEEFEAVADRVYSIEAGVVR